MGYFGSGFIDGKAMCGVEYRFMDQFYDVDQQIKDICKILWDNRVDHNIRFNHTNGNTSIHVRMISKELYEKIEPIYQSAFVYNPDNNIRRKTKDEVIENPHYDVPDACGVMIRLYGSTLDPYRNGFVEKVYGYLYKYFYHQHWIHDKCDDIEKDREFISLVSRLQDEEILMIPGIGHRTKPLVMKMRDDILSGKFKLPDRIRPRKKSEDKEKKKLMKLIKGAKVIEDWGEFEKETYEEYGIPIPKDGSADGKIVRKAVKHSGKKTAKIIKKKVNEK